MNNSVIFTSIAYPGNVGDFWCSPLHYYSFPFKIEHIHYMDIVEDLRIGNTKRYKNRKIIIGGGGIINQEGGHLSETLKYLIENNIVILWGIGSNSLGQYSWEIINHPNIILKGIRDWVDEIDENDYLPCVSCKNKVFDNFIKREPINDIGLLEHSNFRIGIKGIPAITNNQNIFKFLSFIADNKNLISSTYHGIYWAQLLKRNVAYYSNSNVINSKFQNLKYPVSIVTNKNFRNSTSDISLYEGYLEENRILNDEFYHKVLKAIM